MEAVDTDKAGRGVGNGVRAKHERKEQQVAFIRRRHKQIFINNRVVGNVFVYAPVPVTIAILSRPLILEAMEEAEISNTRQKPAYLRINRSDGPRRQ